MIHYDAFYIHVFVMTKKIICCYLKTEQEALLQAPLPGALGDYLLHHVSKKAWGLWLEEQTKIINENRLAVYKPHDKKLLLTKLKDFFQIDNHIE